MSLTNAKKDLTHRQTSCSSALPDNLLLLNLLFNELFVNLDNKQNLCVTIVIQIDMSCSISGVA